jgi:DNA adenine methylase
MNTVLKYPGAKSALADWIIDFFPEHHSYLEPFMGSLAVLIKKPRSNIETANDLDGEVVNLFECIRNDPEKLATEIYFTPYARQIYEEAYALVPPDDRYQRARNFFIQCNMGHGFRTNGEKVGWKNDVQGRERAYAMKQWNALPEDIIRVAERLKGVQIDNRPAEELIPRFNHSNVLIYADPPYMLETRHGKQYRCEMDDRQHETLLEVLKAHKGPVLLSGYETDLYSDMLRGWHKEYKTSYSQVMSKKIEVLYMNFEPVRQMELAT